MAFRPLFYFDCKNQTGNSGRKGCWIIATCLSYEVIIGKFIGKWKITGKSLEFA